MIPGMGRFDPGVFSTGGFEIVIGKGTYAEQRDQMLAMYREHNIAPRGTHVTNKEQEVGPAELPEGGEMTMELRQQVAKLRASNGYTVLPGGAAIEEDGQNLAKTDETYLNGVVDAPNWDKINEAIQEALTPMTVVMPRELECPSPEAASRTNRLFWEGVESDPDTYTTLCRQFAAGWVASASKALTIWPPEVRDSQDTDVPYDGVAGQRTAFLTRYTYTASVTPAELRERELTLRNWFANELCARIANTVDCYLYAQLTRPGYQHTVLIADTAEILPAVAQIFRAEPVSWVMDGAAQEGLGMTPGQVMEDAPGVQAICEDFYPFPRSAILVRAERCGHHSELPNAFEVEIRRDVDEPDRLHFTLSYWNAMDVDPDAPGFATLNVVQPSAGE